MEKELVEFVVKSLVDAPDEEGIDEADDDAGAGAGASVAADVVVERPDFLPVPV